MAAQGHPSSPNVRADVVLVGAGILGLAVARELLTRRPELRLTVLEKEAAIARHQTGHNSGVIHTGIYYAPGSLKAQLCVEGRRLMYEFCAKKGIPTERCGKVIVAADESELPRLEELRRRGEANGVRGLEEIGPERLAELEPNVVGVRALHSPETGIVDFKLVARALAAEVEQRGGTILTGHEVSRISSGDGGATVRTNGGEFRAGRLVTCAGLQSDRLAVMTGAPRTPRIVPFRGTYYALSERAGSLVNGLVYPVPDPTFPFLGVHFTKQISGEMWAGPNAVLAFAREGYRLRDFRRRELWETLSYRGFRRMGPSLLADRPRRDLGRAQQAGVRRGDAQAGARGGNRRPGRAPRRRPSAGGRRGRHPARRLLARRRPQRDAHPQCAVTGCDVEPGAGEADRGRHLRVLGAGGGTRTLTPR
jgi:(S)-2-hydroxyglutarate dehydrogenase